MKKRSIIFVVLAALALAGALLFMFKDQLVRYFIRPTASILPEAVKDGTEERAEVIATGLDTPWGIAFLPDGTMLVTERPGTVKRVAANGATYQIEGVTETSEGGLLGIAAHPDFAANRYVYLYSTYTANGSTLNRVQRYVFSENALTLERAILEGIPGSSNHDGGALAFGPDGKLYITTGDANIAAAPQNTESLAGKILRLNDDGSVPADNPFKNPVYSYGHRNPQGIAWDDQGRLWATEHGPSGSDTGRDELNLIEKGSNYGWPVISGDETRDGMRTPVAQSGDNETWAPGAIAFNNGALFFTGLRGQTLYEAKLTGKDTKVSVSLSRRFSEQYGRLRAATFHNNALYISTSNKDGRGKPAKDDDKIIRIPFN